MPYGWHCRLLEVDLGSGSHAFKELDKGILVRYLGGRGLGARLFLDYASDPSVDPLGGENPVILATGPLTATPAPTAGRLSVSFRSPLSSTISDSNLGGHFGALMKTTGIDALVILGRAPKPVYVYFDEQKVEIRPAGELWGKDVSETTAILKGRYGRRATVLAIGRAGERKVRFACVMNDGGRAFGRGGLGAVFGAKNLKALVTCGGKARPSLASPDDFKDAIYEIGKLLATHPITSKVYKPLGTAGILGVINERGLLGTRNFQGNRFEEAGNISGETLREQYLVRNEACWGCPIMCGRVSEVEGQRGSGPEFETLYALGSNLGIGDLKTVILANFLANDLGLDTISLGGVIAFAMEATEAGVYDFGIRFGEAGKLLKMVRRIGLREGVGDLLAEGAARAAAEVGGEELAMHVKGLELPAYDPRGAQGMGLVYATSNRGACHLRGGLSVTSEIFGVPRRIDRFQSTGKGAHVARYQDSGAIFDSLIVCRFTSLATSLQHWARVFRAVTGLELAAADLQQVGTRIYNLERMVNVRLGFKRDRDTLPRRFLKEPVPVGDREPVVRLEEMLDEYYEYRGWDGEGVPKEQTLRELGLKEDIPWA